MAAEALVFSRGFTYRPARMGAPWVATQRVTYGTVQNSTDAVEEMNGGQAKMAPSTCNPDRKSDSETMIPLSLRHTSSSSFLSWPLPGPPPVEPHVYFHQKGEELVRYSWGVPSERRGGAGILCPLGSARRFFVFSRSQWTDPNATANCQLQECRIFFSSPASQPAQKKNHPPSPPRKKNKKLTLCEKEETQHHALRRRGKRRRVSLVTVAVLAGPCGVTQPESLEARKRCLPGGLCGFSLDG